MQNRSNCEKSSPTHGRNSRNYTPCVPPAELRGHIEWWSDILLKDQHAPEIPRVTVRYIKIYDPMQQPTASAHSLS